MAGVTVEGLDIGLPYIGMEVEYEFAFSISRKANGSRIVQDLGQTRDVVFTTAQFRLTTTKAKQLLDVWADRERDRVTVVWPDGTFPLGPAYPNGRTLEMDILDISGDVTMDSPWRSCVVTVKLMCSITGQSTSTSTQIEQGRLSIGGYDGFTYPQVSTDIAYGVKREAQGSNKAQMSAMRAPLDEVACSTWTFNIPQANAGNLQSVLIGARGGNVEVTSAVAHTIWGVRTPQDGGFGANGYDGQARQVSKSIVMRQTDPLRWSLKVTMEESETVDYILSYLDEAEISMLTTDGSSGESMFTLTPVFSDAGSHSASCTWSSDSAHITVDSVGKVTCLVSGSPVTATISCTLGAVTKTVSVTGYATLPALADRYNIKGGTGDDETIITPYFSFEDPVIATNDPLNACFVALQHRITTAGTYPDYNNLQGIEAINPSQQRAGVNYNPFYQINDGAGTVTVYWVNYVQNLGDLVTETHSYNGVSYLVNGSSYASNFQSTSPSGATGAIALRFLANTRKIVIVAWGESASMSETDMQNKSLMEYFFIPQNYIRYTDTMSRTNYTIIPNMGTLGASYNLAANNVPSGWFGV